jgi:hypothetical protein
MIGGFGSRQGLGIFLFTTASRPALGPTKTPIHWVRGVLPLGVKRQGREADHSPPSSAEVKKAWNILPLLLYAFMAWCSAKSSGTNLRLPSKFYGIITKMHWNLLVGNVFLRTTSCKRRKRKLNRKVISNKHLATL